MAEFVNGQGHEQEEQDSAEGQDSPRAGSSRGRRREHVGEEGPHARRRQRYSPALQDYRNRYCTSCQIAFHYAGMLDEHLWECHRDLFIQDQVGGGEGVQGHPQPEHHVGEIEFEGDYFGGLYTQYRLDLTRVEADFVEINGLFHTYGGQLRSLLQHNLNMHRGIRVSLTANVDMVRKEGGEIIDRLTVPFVSYLHTILDYSMVDRTIDLIRRKLDSTFQNLRNWPNLSKIHDERGQWKIK